MVRGGNGMKFKIIFLLLLISINALAINSTTTYTCSDTTTLFKNTTYSDGTYSYDYQSCENGCLNGFCVSTSETNNFLNLTIVLLLIISIILIMAGNYFYSENQTIGLSLMGIGILIILLSLFLIGVYGKSFTNPIMKYVGSISFNISSLFLLGFVLIAVAVMGLRIIKSRNGGLVGWD